MSPGRMGAGARLAGWALLAAATCAGLAVAGGPHGAAPTPEVAPRGPDPRTAPVEERSARRAFYTAPPVVPHDVTRYERDQRSCLRCHLQETPLGPRTSMKVPHPELSSCMQCHVAASTPLVVLHPERPERARPRVETGFQGLAEPREGSRAHDLAPPTVPHRLQLRRNCVACHNPRHPNEAMRMDHPERSSCLQCHVPQARASFDVHPGGAP